LLFVASGDLRNVIRTVNGLPLDYTGQLTLVINDRDPFVTLRNILLLQMLGTITDKREAVDLALHFWYSAFIPAEYHLQISMIAMELLQDGSRNVALGPNAHLQADVNHDMRMMCGALCMSEQAYDMSHAANELGRIRYIIITTL
jgi:hypothetical protein